MSRQINQTVQLGQCSWTWFDGESWQTGRGQEEGKETSSFNASLPASFLKGKRQAGSFGGLSLCYVALPFTYNSLLLPLLSSS